MTTFMSLVRAVLSKEDAPTWTNPIRHYLAFCPSLPPVRAASAHLRNSVYCPGTIFFLLIEHLRHQFAQALAPLVPKVVKSL
jgi:hypothetical protein